MGKVVTAVGIAFVVVIVVIGVAINRGDDDDQMAMTSASNVKSSMGVSRMSDVPRRGPDDAIAELSSKVVGGVRRFELRPTPVRWEFTDERTVAAWGYEGQVPGPAIRVKEGEQMEVKVTNDLPVPTTVHWHGVELPYLQDGVPGVSQKPIQPGESFTYRFAAKPAGTRFYHTHGAAAGNEAAQMDMGLSGPLIIEPAGEAKPDRDYTLVLDEWSVDGDGMNAAAAFVGGGGMSGMEAGAMASQEPNVFTLNGRAAPDTEPLKVSKGDVVRIRFINAGTSATHPMHIHGTNFKVTATDGNPVPAAAQLTKNTISVAPGETYDVTFTATNPGVWAVHCHELHHADGGMMTILQYDGFEPVGASEPDTSKDEPAPKKDTSDDSMGDMPGM